MGLPPMLRALRFARAGEQFAQLRSELADLERRMTIRLGSVTVAAVGVAAALSKLI